MLNGFKKCRTVCVCVFSIQNEYTNRRMSDPSSSWNYFQHGSLKRTGVRKSRSELENVDAASTAGCNEVEAGNIEDGKQIICALSAVL